jgi:hypothetical protein
MNWLKWCCLLPVLCSAGALRADDDPAPPPDALTKELRIMAGDFAQIITGQGGGIVSVSEFSPLEERDGSVGPRVQLVLAQELKSKGVTVDTTNVRFTIKGDYQAVTDQSSGLFGVKVIGRLIDRQTGEPLAEKPTARFVFGSQTVPSLLGLNVSGDPTSNARELSARFEAASQQPQADVIGTRVQGNTRQYAIEVLVKQGSGYVARPLTTADGGRPFAELKANDIFGVRLINDSPHEAAVDLCIDGINCFAFNSTGGQYWIIAPGTHLDVIGWQQNDSVTKEFKVVADFPSSAAAKLNLQPSTSIGLISATFCACWETESQRPSDEQQGGARAAGFGNDVDFQIEKVRRTIGQVRDTLTVRYER